MKRTLLIFVIVVAVVAIVSIVVNKKTKTDKDNSQSYQSEWQSQNRNQDQSEAENALVKSIKNDNEFVGVISTIYDPKGKDVRFLKIEADVFNLDELKNVDFSRRSPNLPMTKEVFKIAVDDSTKLKNVESKEKINSGDMVRVKSGMSIYELKEFTALEVEVVATR